MRADLLALSCVGSPFSRLGLTAVLLAACGPTVADGVRETDRTAVRRWLLCEECVRGELDSLTDPARRDRAVPLLAQALAGPSLRRRENVRHQLEEIYQQLATRAANQGRALPRTLDDYVAHHLSNYVAVYQTRAVVGLVEIGTPEARAALDDAVARVRTGERIYRGDVLQELNRATGVVTVGLATTWSFVTAGRLRTCGLRSDSTAYCWGVNDEGQLGDGTLNPRSRPTLVAGNHRFSTMVTSAHGQHSCGIATDRTYCWGSNARGELGNPSAAQSSVPMPIMGAFQFVWTTAGRNHTCALSSSGQAHCWGANQRGQLGNGQWTDANRPVPVEGTLRFRSLSAGVAHGCAVATDDKLYCWGDNAEGQLGMGPSHPTPLPTQLLTHLPFKSVAAGAYHTCALTETGPVTHDGAAYCTGRNSEGQLGDNTTTSRPDLQKLASAPYFESLGAGDQHTCGIESGRQVVWCWGDNQFGQLGDGSTDDRKIPVEVLGSRRFSVVSSGAGHTCGVTVQGEAYCWGRNTEGQLGDGTTSNQSEPTLVLYP
jgi:alpha-tubulin suppressor-like RCC1 family protein